MYVGPRPPSYIVLAKDIAPQNLALYVGVGLDSLKSVFAFVSTTPPLLYDLFILNFFVFPFLFRPLRVF